MVGVSRAWRRAAGSSLQNGQCELVLQTSSALCELERSFGCDPTSGRMWVSNCRGEFRCASSTVHCGYPPGQSAYVCDCNGSNVDPRAHPRAHAPTRPRAHAPTPHDENPKERHEKDSAAQPPSPWASQLFATQYCVHLPDMPQPVPTFYMPEDLALNHADLRHCEGFAALRASSRAENTAEVGLHKVLRSHPARVTDPALASLVYLPVWEFTSRSLGECRNTTHRGRMWSAWRALRASRAWLASCGDAGDSCGAGHLWVSTAYSVPKEPLAASMAPLSSVLGGSVVGRYKNKDFPGYSQVCALG